MTETLRRPLVHHARHSGAIAAVCAWFVAATAAAATVTAVAPHSQGSDVFLRLAPGEHFQKGQVLRIERAAKVQRPGKGPKVPPLVFELEVSDVAGDRARAVAKPGPTPDVGETVGAVEPVQTPAVGDPARVWKVAPASAEGSVQDEQTWTSLAAGQPQIVPSKRSAGAPSVRELRPQGDLTLVALMVGQPGGQTWATARLTSHLTLPSLGGSPVAYRHDLGLDLDTLGGVPRSAAERSLRVRLLEGRIATGRDRRWGGSLGRTLVGDGALLQAVDGAAVRVAVWEGAELEGYGGLTPDPLGFAPDVESGRLGARLTWSGTAGDAQAWWAAGYGAETWQGGLDRQTLGAGGWIEHPRWGTGYADLSLVLAPSDLTGTPFAASGSPQGVHLGRALVDLATPTARWRGRLRYVYQSDDLTRQWAARLPYQGWTVSDHQALWTQMDLPPWLGVTWQPEAWVSRTSSGDAYEGWQGGLGLGTSGSVDPLGRWTWNAGTFLRASGSQQALGLSAGGRWQRTESQGWHARARTSLETVGPVEVAAVPLGVHVGADWRIDNWLIAADLGGEQALAVDGPNASAYFDCMVLVSRRL
jgi:hypothetical protein